MPKKTRNRAADTHANVEQDLGDAALRENQAPIFNKPVRVTFCHTRKRLADIDGLSGKYVVDALVAANVFTNDTPQQVAEVRHYQTKGSPEETRIVIEEIL